MNEKPTWSEDTDAATDGSRRVPLPSFDWDAVRGWARGRVDGASGARVVGRVPLVGGEVSDAVERLDVAVCRDTGDPLVLPLVYKRTWPWELVALRALKQFPTEWCCAPALLDGGEDDGGAWVLTPFYDGTHPVEHGGVPVEVFEWLAAMHAHFMAHPEQLAGLGVIDAGFWRHLCLDEALSGVQAALVTRPHATLERAASLLHLLAEDARMVRALDVLPATLVHGDVHAGNVLVGGDSAVLIDWGNARIGPAMLDVANCAPEGSPNYAAYCAAFRRADAMPFDRVLTRVGYEWAVVHVNVQYLGWAAQHIGIDHVDGMLDRAEASLMSLGDALATVETRR